MQASATAGSGTARRTRSPSATASSGPTRAASARSPLPGGPFSYVEDVRALVDHLGLGPVALVGNSFGGRIAIDVTLTHPELVRALVLVAPGLGGFEGSPELDAFDEEEDALLDAGRIEEAVELNLAHVAGRRRAGPRAGAAGGAGARRRACSATRSR